jgi:hypothetical protein
VETVIKFSPRDQDIVWRNLRDFPQAGADVMSDEVRFSGRGDADQERRCIARLSAIFKTASL